MSQSEQPLLGCRIGVYGRGHRVLEFRRQLRNQGAEVISAKTANRLALAAIKDLWQRTRNDTVQQCDWGIAIGYGSGGILSKVPWALKASQARTALRPIEPDELVAPESDMNKLISLIDQAIQRTRQGR